jgi:PAS domain S-box-containing protein
MESTQKSKLDTTVNLSLVGPSRKMFRHEAVPGVQVITYDAIVNSLSDQLMVLGVDYRILYANQAFLDFHRKTLAQVIGQPCYNLSHGFDIPCPAPEHECPLTAVVHTGMPFKTTHRHVSQSGEDTNEIYVGISSSPIKDSRGNVVAVVELMHDITQAKHAEIQVEETYRDLLALGFISSVVSQSLDLNTVLENALDMLLDIMKTDIGGILLLDDEKQMLCYRAHRGFTSPYVDKVCYPLDEDINGYVFQTGEIVVAEDITSDPRTIKSALIKAEMITSFISVPLVAKKKKLGVLYIASRKAHKFSNEDTQFLASAVPQIAMAVENALLHREVEHKEQIRGDLLKEIFSIQEEERRRIARELHDETSQTLASLSAHLEAILQGPDNDPDKIRAKIKNLQPLFGGILNEIHRIIYELRPSVLDDMGLTPAIRWLATNKLESNGIKVRLKTIGRNQRLPSGSESSLYRVIQEAVTNIVRHSGAKNAVVAIRFNRDNISVHIGDDGSGFDVEEITKLKEGPRGLGLLGMRERIEFMGGQLNIKSQPGKGTKIDIKIPFACPVPVNLRQKNE